jgi:type I restriction enzyme, R subunit
MSPGTRAGQAFGDRVEYELLQRGWETATGAYNAELGIHTGALWEFISKTQFKSWRKLLELYGGDQDTAMRQFALRVASEIDSRGVLDVLRQGVRDRGVQTDLAYFRPGLALAGDALAEYDANVLSVARQLHFSHCEPSQSVDLALFVNGLPVATIELKSPNTRQDAGHAITQYRQRDPNELFFARRTLVHFAVDPDRAFITTRLKGEDTQFLPFNAESAGPGRAGGVGKQRGVRDDECLVSYLWQDIWHLARHWHLLPPSQGRAQRCRRTWPGNARDSSVGAHQYHIVVLIIAARRHPRTTGRCAVNCSCGITTVITYRHSLTANGLKHTGRRLHAL